MRRAAPLLALALASCGSASLRGATSLAPGQTPVGEPRGRFSARSCEDGRGQPAPAPAIELELRALSDGRELLLERRRGYDAIVVTNRFEASGHAVFQFVSESAGGSELLHELRFARSASATGTLLVADEFDVADVPSGFRGSARRVVLRCALVRAARGDLDTTAGLE